MNTRRLGTLGKARLRGGYKMPILSKESRFSRLSNETIWQIPFRIFHLLFRQKKKIPINFVRLLQNVKIVEQLNPSIYAHNKFPHKSENMTKFTLTLDCKYIHEEIFFAKFENYFVFYLKNGPLQRSSNLKIFSILPN